MAQSARAVDRFLELPYHIVLVRDEDGGAEESWTARVEELPGCEARDQTPEGAAQAISKAMEDWLAAALERGAEVPEPRRASSHSGRLLLRIPQALHADLAHKADMEDVSLNGLITGMLAGAVGWPREDATGAAGSNQSPADSPPDEAAARSRFLSGAIIANIVVVVLAALAAIALLIIAWLNGW
jgi:predicted HicB family RNase H-like nuclease